MGKILIEEPWIPPMLGYGYNKSILYLFGTMYLIKPDNPGQNGSIMSIGNP